MQLAEAPISTILSGLREGTIDASLYNWTYGSTDPSPANQLRSDGGQNWNSFENTSSINKKHIFNTMTSAFCKG